jgi:outer membrane protein assembly factor BamB
VATIPLPDPDWLVSAAGDVWVKRDDGQVSRIDANSGRAVASLPTGYSDLPACQGLTSDGTRLWTCSGENRLVTLDPRTNKTGERVRVSRLSDQTRFAVGHDLLWVVKGNATTLSGLNLQNGSIAATVDLGTFCIDLARPANIENDRLYVVCPTDGLVLAVDVASGSVTDRLQLDDPRLAAVADDLWVGFSGGLAQIDTDTMTVTAVYPVTPGLFGSIWVEGQDVWVRVPGSAVLTHIDGRRHRIVEVLTSHAYPSGGDVLVFDGSLWTTAADDGVLLKLDLAPSD